LTRGKRRNRVDWDFLLEDLTTFLVELNKDRAEGKRLPKKNIELTLVSAPENFTGEGRQCATCKVTFPLDSRYFHRQEGVFCQTCKNCKNSWQRNYRKKLKLKGREEKK